MAPSLRAPGSKKVDAGSKGGYGRIEVVRVRVLGPVEASAGGRPLSLGTVKQRALLAMLALHANQTLPADALLDRVQLSIRDLGPVFFEALNDVVELGHR